MLRIVVLLVFGFAATVIDSSAWAQESGGDRAAPATIDADAEYPAAAKFNEVYTSWKDLLQELRDIQAQYSLADENELEGLRQQWNEKLAAGHDLVPQLQATAVAAFEEAPNEDRELSRLIIKFIADRIRSDQYDEALELSEALLTGGCDEKELPDLAGIASFATGDYAAAKVHLQEASSSASISDQGSKFLADVDATMTAWEQEQQLREAEAAADDLPRVQLTTSAGDIVLELFENEAPETVGNLVSLVEKGFYDGLTFHRVLPGFMAQAGCPKGDGTGGPGYRIYCECVNSNHRKHFRGSLSMAKETARHTGGSQFFICLVPTTNLNGEHTVFGRVIEGLDVLSKIQRRDPSGAPPLPDPTVITKAEVLRKRDHEYRPNKVK